MGFEIRTLTRTVCALVVVALLAVGVSAKQHRRHDRLLRHDNGRHLGWTIGRHRGWSHSRHYGVTRNRTTRDIFRRRHRDDRGVIIRRDDRDRDLGERISRDERETRGDRVGLGRGAGLGRGIGRGRGRGRP